MTMKWVKPSQVEDMTGRRIRLRADRMKPEYRDDFNLICTAVSGFGCHRDKMGRAVFVEHQDGERARWERNDVEAVEVDENDNN